MKVQNLFDDVTEAIGGDVYSFLMTEDVANLSPEGTIFTVILDVQDYTMPQLEQMAQDMDLENKLLKVENEDLEFEDTYEAFQFFTGSEDGYPFFPGTVITTNQPVPGGEYQTTDEYLEETGACLADVFLFEVNRDL